VIVEPSFDWVVVLHRTGEWEGDSEILYMSEQTHPRSHQHSVLVLMPRLVYEGDLCPFMGTLQDFNHEFVLRTPSSFYAHLATHELLLAEVLPKPFILVKTPPRSLSSAGIGMGARRTWEPPAVVATRDSVDKAVSCAGGGLRTLSNPISSTGSLVGGGHGQGSRRKGGSPATLGLRDTVYKAVASSAGGRSTPSTPLASMSHAVSGGSGLGTRGSGARPVTVCVSATAARAVALAAGGPSTSSTPSTSAGCVSVGGNGEGTRHKDASPAAVGASDIVAKTVASAVDESSTPSATPASMRGTATKSVLSVAGGLNTPSTQILPTEGAEVSDSDGRIHELLAGPFVVV